MAKFTIRNQGQVDLLTQAELEEVLNRVTRDNQQEKARGVNTARFTAVSTVATGAVAIPTSDQQRVGPGQGFAWAVQRVTAAGLAATDQLLVYRNAISPFNLVGVITATNSLTPGSKALILRADETLHIVGAGLTATGDIAVNGEAKEVPELDVYKLL